MHPSHKRAGLAAALAFACLAVTPVLAEKPDWAGGGKPDKGNKGGSDKGGSDKGGPDKDRGGGQGGGDSHGYDNRGGATVSLRFGDRQRSIARDYYHSEFSRGNCPPGLAKKNNGCMPPGQAKKWSRGRALPRDVVYYDLPRSLVIELGVPPEGHRYVRVASDILLIAVGSMMVVDAIEDLSSM